MRDLDDLHNDELIEGSDDADNNTPTELDDLIPMSLPDESDDTEDEDSDPFFVGTKEDFGDDDEEDDGGYSFENDDEEESNDTTVITENAVINELLKLKGIDDPKAVKFEDEDGNLVVEDFYQLPYEEQIEILKSSDSDINYGLDDTELDTINFLRRNNVSFEDAIEYYKRQAVDEYIKDNSTAEFKVDNYTNEELFMLDLKTRYEDWSDDELQLELEKEQTHPDLFNKKVERIREEYKSLEEIERQEEENSKLAQENEKFEELKNDLINVATEVETIGGIDIELDDKNNVLEFILAKDVNGKSSLDKLIADPNKLFELAWYAVKGKDAFEFVHTYYRKEIETARKTAYNKAKEELGKVAKAPDRKNAIRKDSPATSFQKKFKSVDDLHN